MKSVNTNRELTLKELLAMEDSDDDIDDLDNEDEEGDVDDEDSEEDEEDDNSKPQPFDYFVYIEEYSSMFCTID